MNNFLNISAMLDKFNAHKQLVGIAVVTVIAVVILLIRSVTMSHSNETITKPKVSEELPVQNEVSPQVEARQKQIKVDVKGAVKYSGVYDAKQGERIQDVLKHAEVLPNADLDAVNLSQEIRDALVIYIPFKGEVKTDKFTLYQSSTSSVQSSVQNNAHEKVNINQAEQSQLEEIPGIGPKKAQDIIKYRTDNGGFKSIEEIKEIRGVGEKTYESLKDYIEV
ncbi:helix-hairpin-helix domain-containing protein [Macrococcus armenti]|uniref:helix-hairpin-helix domain-containing protein n=1 Tax=Macrococcus armenti TaxID=2875764 RepID=UPI001CCA21BE|nr:helix-hairpin-helix domain-containing protein [Macrococcus armenti]UBH12337.1 helix-hairpin-helix domain-containing protein [Macrococcus armenti]UBH21482.1 helix-hairpin-helix domain-containing protein [Macrococcus armenti]